MAGVKVAKIWEWPREQSHSGQKLLVHIGPVTGPLERQTGQAATIPCQSILARIKSWPKYYSRHRRGVLQIPFLVITAAHCSPARLESTRFWVPPIKRIPLLLLTAINQYNSDQTKFIPVTGSQHSLWAFLWICLIRNTKSSSFSLGYSDLSLPYDRITHWVWSYQDNDPEECCVSAYTMELPPTPYLLVHLHVLSLGTRLLYPESTGCCLLWK